MEKRTEEWLRQADYDIDTAEYMHQGGRYLHAVFMCHLAVEKALKGFYFERCNEFPPKSHSLVFLLNEVGVNPPENLGRFVVRLSEASIPARCPENLSNVQKEFTERIVKDILARGKEVIFIMDKGTVVKIIDRFRQEIEARGVTAQKIILYGSHASGTSAAVSDIDVVVISDDFAGKGYWERIDILTDVIYEISAPMEAVAMTPEEWEQGDSFIADFARHGEVLYAA